MTLAKNKTVVIDAASDAICKRMTIGAEKYNPDGWRGESVVRHVRRAIRHAVTALEIRDGDRVPADGEDDEDHLAAACCRLAMAVALNRKPEADVV